MIRQLPNILSWFRVGLIPVMVLCFFIPRWGGLAAAAVFGLAALTDLFDGLLARNLNVGSRFGDFFDPVADKLLVASALLLLLALPEPPLPRWLLTLLAAVVILREIAVSALREWMARAGRSAVTAVSWVGKSKTATQLTALPTLLAAASLPGWQLDTIGGIVLAAAAGLGLASMVSYVRAALGGAS